MTRNRARLDASRTKISTEVLSESTESTKSTTLSPKNANADAPSAHNAHPKKATGIATYSAHELFVQQNLNGTTGNSHLHTSNQPDTPPATRSAACLLLLVMIAISLLNVGLFVRLHMLSDAGRLQHAQHSAAANVVLLSDIRAQDVSNLSSDQWIHMFYSYHMKHQSKLAEMRHLLIESIVSLQKMESNMLAVIASVVPPPLQHEQTEECCVSPTTVLESAGQENASIDTDSIE